MIRFKHNQKIHHINSQQVGYITVEKETAPETGFIMSVYFNSSPALILSFASRRTIDRIIQDIRKQIK